MTDNQIKDKEAQLRKLDKRAQALRANLKRRKEQALKPSPSGEGLDEGPLPR